MARIYMIRHGVAAGSYAEAADPPLDETGRAQAQTVAQAVAAFQPAAIFSSPIRRARETAEPSAQAFGLPVTILPGVGEIPTPEGMALDQRGPWLRGIMAKSWPDAGDALNVWRQGVGKALLGLPDRSLVFSHFVAINAAVGLATGNDQAVIFQPNHTSVTIFEHDGQRLTLIERGQEAATKVL